MINRWEYVEKILSPCAVALWEMEDGGLRIDRRVRWRHALRLRRQEKKLGQEIEQAVVVAAAIQDRIKAAENNLRFLEDARSQDLAGSNTERKRLEEAREALITAAKASDDKAEKKRLRAEAKAIILPKLVRKSNLTEQVAKARAALEAARVFNPGSAKQKAWLLYEVLRLPVQRHPKTKAVTTDKRSLTKLSMLKSVPAASKVIVLAMKEYEKVNQLRTTFVAVKLVQHPNDPDGPREWIFPPYGLHRTGTGRVASGSDSDEKASTEETTNAQNWPKELRDMVIPSRPELCFIQGDYSREEWLVSLILSGDHESFRRAIDTVAFPPKGEDQHKVLAAEIFGTTYDRIADDGAQRTTAKKASYGLGYGMGVPKLSAEMGISMAEAARIKAAYERAFPIVSSWRKFRIEQATRDRKLSTVYGWTRYFWDTPVPAILAFDPSATGADMLKIRLPLVAAMAKKYGGRLVTTTHDSFLIEVLRERVKAALAELHAIMTAPFVKLFNTSFPADCKAGDNWKAVS